MLAPPAEQLPRLANSPTEPFGGHYVLQNAAWGQTGDGNLIAIVGADRRGNYIVEDPAGNWFASPASGAFARGGHYGPGSCGYRALYPHYWLSAYATGRYVIELGPRTAP